MDSRQKIARWSQRLLLLLCLSLLASLALADTYPRQSGVDALNYVFRLTLSDDTDEIVFAQDMKTQLDLSMI